MHVTVATPPAEPPIALADVKAQLQIKPSDTTKDDLVAALISSAVSYYDGPTGVLGRAMVTQEWLLTLDSFSTEGRIELPVGTQEVTEVVYDSPDGTEVALDPAQYRVKLGALLPVYGGSFPSALTEPGSVRITIATGFGAAAAVPAAIRQALILRVAALYGAARRDPTIRREAVEGLSSIDYDVQGTAAAAITRMEAELIAPWRVVRL